MIRCGNLHIDIATADIRDHQGERAKLPPKAVDLLIFLAQRPNQLVTREQVLAQVWSGRVVEENALDQAIFQARAALGDHDRKILVSVPRRGIELRVASTELSAALSASASVPAANDPLANEQIAEASYERSSEVQSAIDDHLATQSVAIPSTQQAPQWRRWAALALVSLVTIGGYGLFQLRAKSNGTAVVFDPRPAVVVQPGTPEELITVLQALAAAKQATRIVRLSGDVRDIDVELRLAGNAKGLLLREKQSTEFYDLEQTRDALRTLMLGAKPTKQTPPAAAAASPTATAASPSALEALLGTADRTFPNVRIALLTSISQQPMEDRFWNELSALQLLSGRVDLAAMLAGPVLNTTDATKLPAIKDSQSVLQFAEHIRAAKNLPEAVASAAALREVCANRVIARYSWMSASCALEQGYAELKAGEDESAAMSLGYARAAFAKNGDIDSEKLVASMEHVAFVNSSELDAVDFSKVMQLSDVRAVGLLLRPLVMQKPKAAFQLAEAALSSPAIAADYSSAISIATALGLAARRSHELALKERALGLLENMVQKVPPGELRSSITQSIIYLHLTTGNVGKAIILIDADPKVPEPQLFRCARGNVFINAMRFAEAKADFEHCFSRRARKSHAGLGMGLLGAVGLASTSRLMGDTDAAIASLEVGRAEFEASTGTELNWYVGAVALWQQHIYLGQAQVVADTCEKLRGTPKAKGCAEGLMLKVNAELHPEMLTPVQFASSAAYASNLSEVLVTDLYLEQKRTGKCSVSAAEFDTWMGNADLGGEALLLHVLRSIREDCVNGRFAQGLKAWPSG